MTKIKKVLQFKIIPLFVALVFSLNAMAYGIDLSGESHLRAPLLFDKDVRGRRIFLKILAIGTAVAAVAKTGFTQHSRL